MPLNSDPTKTGLQPRIPKRQGRDLSDTHIATYEERREPPFASKSECCVRSPTSGHNHLVHKILTITGDDREGVESTEIRVSP